MEYLLLFGFVSLILFVRKMIYGIVTVSKEIREEEISERKRVSKNMNIDEKDTITSSSQYLYLYELIESTNEQQKFHRFHSSNTKKLNDLTSLVDITNKAVKNKSYNSELSLQNN